MTIWGFRKFDLDKGIGFQLQKRNIWGTNFYGRENDLKFYLLWIDEKLLQTSLKNNLKRKSTVL